MWTSGFLKTEFIIGCYLEWQNMSPLLDFGRITQFECFLVVYMAFFLAYVSNQLIPCIALIIGHYLNRNYSILSGA